MQVNSFNRIDLEGRKIRPDVFCTVKLHNRIFICTPSNKISKKYLRLQHSIRMISEQADIDSSCEKHLNKTIQLDQFNFNKKSYLDVTPIMSKKDLYLVNKKEKIKTQRQKSKLPLVLSASIATTLMITSLLTLPAPFNYIIAIAIAGPLSASLLGLKRTN